MSAFSDDVIHSAYHRIVILLAKTSSFVNTGSAVLNFRHHLSLVRAGDAKKDCHACEKVAKKGREGRMTSSGSGVGVAPATIAGVPARCRGRQIT